MSFVRIGHRIAMRVKCHVFVPSWHREEHQKWKDGDRTEIFDRVDSDTSMNYRTQYPPYICSFDGKMTFFGLVADSHSAEGLRIVGEWEIRSIRVVEGSMYSNAPVERFTPGNTVRSDDIETYEMLNKLTAYHVLSKMEQKVVTIV